MSENGWTYENLKEHYAESEKRTLSEQERVRAASGFAGALSEMASLPMCTHAGVVSRDECPYCNPKSARKPRAHPEPTKPVGARVARGPNRTEARYAQYLELQKRAGTVLWWAFEGMTLKLAPDTRYTPDFAVLARVASSRLGELEFHEVKAMDRKTGKPRYEDDARVKIACAAEKFRPLRFLMVWPARNGEWDCKQF